MKLRRTASIVAVGLASNLAFAANLKFGRITAVKASRFEIAEDPNFSNIAAAIESPQVQWKGAKSDRIYHWRAFDGKSAQPRAQGTVAVIGAGKGFVSLLWDDVKSTQSSYDLELTTGNGAISIERLSQNWSTRRRAKYTQYVSISPTGTDRTANTSATFFPSMDLVLRAVSGNDAAAARELAPKEVSTDAKNVKNLSAPTTVVSNVASPIVVRVTEARPSDPVVSGFASRRILPMVGGGLLLSQRSKREIQLNANQPVAVAGFSADSLVWKNLRLGVSIMEREASGAAVIESEFDLPEVNLPRRSRAYGGSIAWTSNISSRMQLTYGLATTQVSGWGLPLAYSSLDGGELFERRQQSLTGLMLRFGFLVTGRSTVELASDFQMDDGKARSRRVTSDLAWRWRLGERFDTGLHLQYQSDESRYCHTEASVCEREGEVSEKERLALGLLSLGYLLAR